MEFMKSFEFINVHMRTNKYINSLISGHRDFLTGGAWSTTRYSVYYLIKTDGTLDVWDFLIQQDNPVLSVKVCNL